MYKGDTFGFGSPIAVRVDGVLLQDLAGWSATFTVTTTSGKPVAQGVCTIASGHLATETLPTDSWPTETLNLNLKLTNGVFIKSLPPVQINFE
jgi:hypothetical protein